jgi:glycosyltransferase involved in cell wall biosynthesis
MAAGESLEALRGRAMALATGDYVAVWDADDLSAPDRLHVQMEALRTQASEACFLSRVQLWWSERQALSMSQPRAWENTLLATRNSLAVPEGLSQKAVRLDAPQLYTMVCWGEADSAWQDIWDAATIRLPASHVEALRRNVPLNGFLPPPALPPVPPGPPRPFWSILIPAHDRPDLLEQCLTSVLEQDLGQAAEILVQDDASPADLAPLVERIGCGRVRYERNLHNLGQIRTVNRLLARSRGLWTHLLHDDDYVKPGFYAELQRGLRTVSDVVGAACTHYVNEVDGKFWSLPRLREEAGLLENWRERISLRNPLNPVAVVMRRAVYETLGCYRDEPCNEDWELYIRVASRYRWWYEPQSLCVYRQHPASMTGQLYRDGTGAARIRRTLELAANYFLPGDAERFLEAARKVHLPLLLSDASKAFAAGELEVGQRILRECAALSVL